jgi:hypothetical protein
MFAMSVRLPEFLFDNISSDPDASHAALVEAAALIDQSLYQDFLGSDPIPLPWGKKVPDGWHLESPAPKDKSGSGFGFPTGLPLQFAVPDGFQILNVTHNGEGSGPGHGYDGLALFNAKSGVLIIADKGLDQSSTGPSVPDTLGVLSDGEYQAHQAVQFLEQSLKLVEKQTGQAPDHVLLTGHSLGGPLATAQAIDLVERHPNQNFEVVNFESIGSSKLVADAVSGAFDIAGNHQHITAAMLHTIEAHAVEFYAPNSTVTIGSYTGTPHIFGPDLGQQVALKGANHDMDTVTPSIQALVADHFHQDAGPELAAHLMPGGVGHGWLLA